MPRSPSPYAHGRSEIWGRGTLERTIQREQRKFGDRVRSLREDAGLTQERAAERIGIHPKHLGRIEGGTVNVTFGPLIALAVAYQVPAAELFAEAQRATKKR